MFYWLLFLSFNSRLPGKITMHSLAFGLKCPNTVYFCICSSDFFMFSLVYGQRFGLQLVKQTEKVYTCIFIHFHQFY